MLNIGLLFVRIYYIYMCMYIYIDMYIYIYMQTGGYINIWIYHYTVCHICNREIKSQTLA